MKREPDDLAWILERVKAAEVSTEELLEEMQLRSITGTSSASSKSGLLSTRSTGPFPTSCP